MTNDELSPELANSAVYIFNRNAKIQAGASDAEAHAAGVKALEESVYGVGAQKDRNGNFIQQGIGAWPHKVTLNSLAAIRKYEGEASYSKMLKKLWHDSPDRARQIGAPEPPRASA
jgi:hypothetical protein